MTENKIVISAHIGSKGIKCGAIDLNTHEIVQGSVFENKVDKDAVARHILSLWSMQIKKTIAQIDLKKVVGIGFSTPGPFDYVNGVAQFTGIPKYETLKGLSVRDELTKRLMLDEDIEMRFINDAVGFGIGQDWISNTGKKTVAIIIDEGFGSAFMENGIPVVSGSRVPSRGNIYDIPFEDGIADDYFSIRGLLNEYSKHGKLIFQNAQNLIRIAHTSDKANELFEKFGNNLSQFLEPILKDFGAEVVTFGGVIGSELSLFEKPFREGLEEKSIHVSLESPKMDNAMFMYGAARLFEEEYWKRLTPILPQLV